MSNKILEHIGGLNKLFRMSYEDKEGLKVELCEIRVSESRKLGKVLAERIVEFVS